MSKGLGFIIFIFITLVVGNMLISSLAPFATAPVVARGETELASIDFSMFAQNGVGKNYITQGYGRTPYAYRYPGGWHDGVDIAAAYGAPVYSPNAGTVLATGNQDDYCYQRGFGKYIAVSDPAQHLVLWYAHLGRIDVATGQSIARGAELGAIGATGLETGPHLHFSIFDANGFEMAVRDGCGPEPTGRDLNPMDYLGTVL